MMSLVGWSVFSMNIVLKKRKCKFCNASADVDVCDAINGKSFYLCEKCYDVYFEKCFKAYTVKNGKVD